MAKDKTITLFRQRKFLNSKDGMAAIEAYVEMEHGKADTGEPHAFLDTMLSITDCSRRVTLEFDAWTLKAIAERRGKIKRFRTLTESYFAALETSYDILAADIHEKALWRKKNAAKSKRKLDKKGK